MTTAADELLRWDMRSLYPEPGTADFDQVLTRTERGVADLAVLLDAHGVGRRDAPSLDEQAMAAVEAVIRRLNEVSDEAGLLGGFLACVTAADANNEAAQAAWSRLQQQTVGLAQINARFIAWLGSLDVDALIARSEIARDHAFALRQARVAAAHLMSPAEEDLAADLRASGADAWFRLRMDTEARLTAPFELDGEERERPISEIENLAFHPERAIRQRAYETSREAWRAASGPLAAALNGVKGETIALCRRRGWSDPLEAALFANRIDRETLEAMRLAIEDAAPEYRRYLRAKARALRLPLLALYDLAAPVGQSTREWPYEDAGHFIAEGFDAFSPRLGDLARRALDERWIDVEPRPGKVGGAFCAPVAKDVSRILLNYAPTFFWASGLAHELGHAYHFSLLNEYGRTWLQRPFPPPLTLVETASTFCETLIHQRALDQSDAAEQISILDSTLMVTCTTIFDTMAAFVFERDLFAARRERDLAIDELNELTLRSQRTLYGEAIDAETLNPLFWAVMPHFSMPDLWFYNFPYAFGMLFGIGLFARYQEDPDAFRARFDEALASTGMADAAELAGRFGIDIRTPAFWRSSLDVVRADIDRFETLVARAAAPEASG